MNCVSTITSSTRNLLFSSARSFASRASALRCFASEAARLAAVCLCKYFVHRLGIYCNWSHRNREQLNILRVLYSAAKVGTAITS
eukprot:47264-Amphidinium_carterae.1